MFKAPKALYPVLEPLNHTTRHCAKGEEQRAYKPDPKSETAGDALIAPQHMETCPSAVLPGLRRSHHCDDGERTFWSSHFTQASQAESLDLAEWRS